MLTVGIDVGSAAVKVAVLRHAVAPETAALEVERYRRRPAASVVTHALDAALARAGARTEDVAYIATTGEGDLAPRRHGHFYGMTSHARGALLLEPRARGVLDCGALHARAIRIDARGRVLGYRMTSQCASGSGQFVENIARYLGVALEDVGRLSLGSDSAEPVSSICAVLAETDVINMVARGVPAPAILRGIHRSIAGRLSKLLRLAGVESPIVVTGGMAADEGLIGALRDQVATGKLGLEIVAPERAVFAGALGAALWGAHRAARVQGDSRKEMLHVHG
ncbi:MAG: BadF/BadG/BcrA/BcrD ATPase family protein [Myxococcota bacterium]